MAARFQGYASHAPKRTIVTGLFALLLASGGNAHADGGRGGTNREEPGGVGGTLASPNGGNAGQLGCGGGGGGGPGGSGGAGTPAGLGDCTGAAGGMGGAGGTHGWVDTFLTVINMTGTAGAAGGEGGFETTLAQGGGGGGGGAGGFGALVSGAALATSFGVVTGGAGGVGGNGGSVPAGWAGSGGSGGDGGVGLSLSGNSLTVFGNVSGGVGGNGGFGSSSVPAFGLFSFGAGGGSGGNGGAALIFTGGDVTNFSTLKGGDGGTGQAGLDGHGAYNGPVYGGAGGNGGNGGAGVVLTSRSIPTFVNNAFGSVIGGNGAEAGTGGVGTRAGQDPGPDGLVGTAGVGGAGLVMLASGGSIQNDGSIQGGMGGPLTTQASGPRPTTGAGGAGLSISGDSNLVSNSGSIKGGKSGTGAVAVVAPSIELGGNFNIVNLHAGTILGGDIVAYGSGNVLNLYDSVDLSSALSNLFQVTNQPDAVWTLRGVVSGTTQVTVAGGMLTLTGNNTYTGITDVTAGTLRAGAANTFSVSSAHTVAPGATLDLAGFSQSIAGLTNGGTVSLLGPAPGTTLTVTGPYVGDNGVLRVGTTLGTDGSVSDRLILDGSVAVASGHTAVQVTNIGGLGGLTTGNGIEIISATNGATTTAQTTKDAFALAGGHVDAGAYEYRLYAATAAGTGENWYLRSTTPGAPTSPTNPGNPGNPGSPSTPGNPTNPANPANPASPTDPATPAGPTDPASPGTPSLPVTPADGTPTYRAEVPLVAALPEQVRQAGLVMLGNLHERIGDDGMPADSADGPEGDHHSWGRVLNQDLKLRQIGAVAPESDGRLHGFQVGSDVFSSTAWRAGAYLGQLDGDMSVYGSARGLVHLDVGHNDARNRYLGIYGTYASEGGLYADAVVQAGRHRYTIDALAGSSVDSKGNSLLLSLEMGQSFMLSERWMIEPQVQIVHQRIDMDDLSLSGAQVHVDSDKGWVGRIGVRLKGAFTTEAGMLQPYARINVYKASEGEDVARFVGPAATTDIATRVGNTSTELATGLTWSMTEYVSLFGEVGRLWGSSGERVASPFKGSIGLQMRW